MNDVLRIFDNPYWKHWFAQISLNLKSSLTKFAFSLIRNEKTHKMGEGDNFIHSSFILSLVVETYNIKTPSDYQHN